MLGRTAIIFIQEGSSGKCQWSQLKEGLAETMVLHKYGAVPGEEVM